MAGRDALTEAPARDQRVIASSAIELVTNAVPALQAIVTIVAIKDLTVAPARNQRVIASSAIKHIIRIGPKSHQIICGVTKKR
jgi:hypothetical protein